MIRNCAHIGVLLGLLLLWTGAGADQGSTLLPVIPAATGDSDSCVEPTDLMRREHMNFLVHQRDDTVLSGIRGAKHSLVGCIGCHVQEDARGAAIPVNAEGQFCESCHSFAGASLDCFECHATVPAEAEVKTALPEWMSAPVGSIARIMARVMAPDAGVD